MDEDRDPFDLGWTTPLYAYGNLLPMARVETAVEWALFHVPGEFHYRTVVIMCRTPAPISCADEIVAQVLGDALLLERTDVEYLGSGTWIDGKHRSQIQRVTYVAADNLQAMATALGVEGP